MKKNVFLFFVFSLSFFYFGISQETEDKHPVLADRFQIEIGTFIPSKNIDVGANGDVPITGTNFGDTFNFNDNEATLFIRLEWYFAKKWKLSVENFSVKAAKNTTLEEDLVWDNVTFKAGSNVRGGFDMSLYRVFIGRTISRGLKHELGAGLGVHALNTGAFIEGNIAINETDFRFERKKVNGIIPLPNIGFWYNFAPTTKWLLSTRVDWFGISVDEYSGGLWDLEGKVQYQLFENIGIGVSYVYFSVNAEVEKSNWNGSFDLTFQGPLFTLSANF